MAFAPQFTNKNIITDKEKQRRAAIHQRNLEEIKRKEGVYKLGRKQSTELKLDFSMRIHKKRYEFDTSEVERARNK